MNERYEEWEQDEDARRALHKALRELDKAKRKKAELVDAVYQAARDAMASLTLPAAPKPAKDARRKAGEVAVVLLSDWQLAKTTPSYNTAVCEERIRRLGAKVRELVAIQRADHPVREIHLLCLGDLIEGEMVFPGQAHLIDASLYRQVMSDGPRILAGLVREMAADFEKVVVKGVIGNHGALGGRARKDYHPETNADAMMMEVARLVCQDLPNVDWEPVFTPGERRWYATDTIGSKTFFLFHGDQVKGGFGGFPWYGFAKRLNGWVRAVAPFDYAVGGHFHTPVRMYLNGIVYWGNGSTESDNTYAQEGLAASGEPSQWLLFCHPDRGITAEYLIRL